MKKRIALVAVLLLVVGLLVSCGNPESLAGTEWNNYLGVDIAKSGFRLSFDTNTVVFDGVALGLPLNETVTFEYTYNDPNVVFSAYGERIGTAVVDGSKMEVKFTGSGASGANGTYKKK